MKTLVLLITLTLTTPAIAARLPHQMNCKFDWSNKVDFQLTHHKVNWKMTYLDGKGRPDFHYRFANLSPLPNRILGIYLSSSVHERGGYIVRLKLRKDKKVNHDIPESTFHGTLTSGAIINFPSNQQQRQEMQWEQDFTCVSN